MWASHSGLLRDWKSLDI